MPMITVSVEDDRHSQNGEFIELMDGPLGAVYDADDFPELFPDEEIEVDWSDMTEDDLDSLG